MWLSLNPQSAICKLETQGSQYCRSRSQPEGVKTGERRQAMEVPAQRSARESQSSLPPPFCPIQAPRGLDAAAHTGEGTLRYSALQLKY